MIGIDPYKEPISTELKITKGRSHMEQNKPQTEQELTQQAAVRRQKLADLCGMEYTCGDGLIAFFGMYVFD